MTVKLRIKLLGEENLNLEVKGIRNDNKIKYLESDMIVTVTLLDNKVIVTRSNNYYQVTLNFEKDKKTISTYSFIGGRKTFELETFTNELLISDNKVFIKYNLEENDFEFTLEVIE